MVNDNLKKKFKRIKIVLPRTKFVNFELQLFIAILALSKVYPMIVYLRGGWDEGTLHIDRSVVLLIITLLSLILIRFHGAGNNAIHYFPRGFIMNIISRATY